MMIHEITAKVGRYKKRKRIGRGVGSGHGKTAGRGHKGARSRSGASGSIHPASAGGQMPLFRRLPKRGFNNVRFRKIYQIVNTGGLDSRFKDGATVDPQALANAGLIANVNKPVKILGNGDLSKKITVTASAFSDSAVKKISDAGGSTSVES